MADCSLENLDAERATGFVFERFDAVDFSAALGRAFALFKRRGEWNCVQRLAMSQRFGWDTAAIQYVAQYRRLLQ